MIGNNLLAWSLQIAMLVAVAGPGGVRAAPTRARRAAAVLAGGLLASLALPLVRPWKHAVVATADSVSAVTILRTVHLPAHRGLSSSA